MDGSNTNKLLRLLERRITDSENPNAESITRDFFESEKELLVEWARERFLLLAQSRIKALRRKKVPHPYQACLGGFADLSITLSTRDGGRLVLGEMTLTDIRRKVKPVDYSIGARAKRLANLEEGMEPYSAIQPGLKVKRYCELRAAGVSVEEFARERNRGKRKRPARDNYDD